MTCTWKDALGTSAAITGVTRDISAGGLFVYGSQRPPAGAIVTLDIRLPVRGMTGHPVLLHGNGRIVRTGEYSSGTGFAVARSFAWCLTRSKDQFLEEACK